MNWFDLSILVMLAFVSAVYLVLIYLTSSYSRPKAKAGQIVRKNSTVGDEHLTEYVRNRLRLRPGLSGVAVLVREGEVRLSGIVGSGDDRDLAGNVARSVPQVRSVRNDLRVRARLTDAVA